MEPTHKLDTEKESESKQRNGSLKKLLEQHVLNLCGQRCVLIFDNNDDVRINLLLLLF